MECVALMTTDRAHMLVLTELVLLLLMESSVMTKLVEISRLAFRGTVTGTVMPTQSAGTTTGTAVQEPLEVR